MIRNVLNQDNGVRRLLGYDLDFQPAGIVNLNNGAAVVQGGWDVVRGSAEASVLAITFSETPELNFEWSLNAFFDNHLEFSTADGSELVIEQACEDGNDALLEQVAATLMNGTWQVASFSNDRDVLTAEYAGYAFSFGSEHLLGVSSNVNPLETGLWRVTRKLEGGLTVYLNLGADGGQLSEFTLDWDLVSITDDRIELRGSANSRTSSALVFEKI